MSALDRASERQHKRTAKTYGELAADLAVLLKTYPEHADAPVYVAEQVAGSIHAEPYDTDTVVVAVHLDESGLILLTGELAV